MASVHVETGEVVEVLTEQEARELTEQIADGLGEVWSLIKRAYLGRAWVPLGFGSWDDYVDETFGVTRIRLPREDRQEVVASLRESGLSIRAIASATGISPNTVQKDLDQVCQSDTPDGPREPDIAPITGTDGKRYRPVDPDLISKQAKEADRLRRVAEKAERDAAAKAADHAERTLHDQARKRYPDVDRASITREMSALFDTASDLLAYDAAETAAYCNDLETDVRILQARTLVDWLTTHLAALENPGATVTNLRSAQ